MVHEDPRNDRGRHEAWHRGVHLNPYRLIKKLWNKIYQLKFLYLFKNFIGAYEWEVKINGSSTNNGIPNFGFVVPFYANGNLFYFIIQRMIFTDCRYLFTAYSSAGVLKSKPRTSISEITEM